MPPTYQKTEIMRKKKQNKPKISLAVKAALLSHGIEEGDVLRLAHLDMNRDALRCDCFAAVTKTGVALLSGLTEFEPTKTRRAPRQVTFRELTYDFYPYTEYSDFSSEEMISTSRLMAKHKDSGDFVLLSHLTFASRGEAMAAAAAANAAAEEKDLPKEEKEELFCPKCGRRYADAERKICPHCMDKRRIIARLGTFMMKYKMKVLSVVLCLMLTSAAGVLTPYISTGFFYDKVLDSAGEFYGHILLVIGLMAATRLFSMLCDLICNAVTADVSAHIVYDLKVTIFKAIERLSMSFFTGRQTGGLMTQINADSSNIYWLFVNGMPYFIINLTQAVAVLAIMLIIDPLLTVAALGITPVIALLVLVLYRHMKNYQAARYTRRSEMDSVLSDVLTGVRVVKAFSSEEREIERFGKKSRLFADAERRVQNYNKTAFPIVTYLAYLSTVIIWALGGWKVMHGSMSYGELAMFVAYAGMINGPMFFFIDMVSWIGECVGGMERLCEIMDAEPDVAEREGAVALHEIRGDVEFRDVKFSYEKNREIIKGVSFSIAAGETIGIVGHSGAGKSTIANLLTRMYDVNEGAIFIDGVNVRDMRFQDLRRDIAIVSQETYMFHSTLLENIRYARPSATLEEVVEASVKAGAHDFIMKLPDGYETRIGFGGRDLSGGERQRVSIARAILKNPRILIMDEATAAMDTKTERRIQAAIDELSVGRTTIMIAHRLSTLRNADSLLVIEDGKVVENGTHDELIRKKGAYYKLYTLQLEALKNVGVAE